MASKKPDRPEKNIVHQNAIMVETIHKEERHQKLFTEFGTNPFNKPSSLAPKPNVRNDDTKIDDAFLQTYTKVHQTPTHKYPFPQTTNQEIGWEHEPLVPVTKSNHRPKNSSEITRQMESHFRQTEQAKLSSK